MVIGGILIAALARNVTKIFISKSKIYLNDNFESLKVCKRFNYSAFKLLSRVFKIPTLETMSLQSAVIIRKSAHQFENSFKLI